MDTPRGRSLFMSGYFNYAGGGEVWGIAQWLALGRLGGTGYWVASLVFGALLPSLVALFVVFPLKGQPVAGGWNPAILVGALLLNGAWGLGTALFLRLFGRLLPAVGL